MDNLRLLPDASALQNLTDEQKKYADLISGVKPKHLEPIKEGVEENISVARKYGL